MRYRILSVTIVCLIIVSFSINVFSVESENILENDTTVQNEIENKTLEEQKAEVDQKLEEANTKLEYVQTEMGTTLNKIQELDDSITNYQSQLADLNAQISDLEVKIKETNSKLEEIEAMYNRKQITLKKRVVAMYEAGDSTYIDLLMSSSSIVEFLSNYFLIEQLMQYDTNLLNEMENTRLQIEQIKSNQETQEKQIKTNRQKVNQTQILLQNTKVIQENYILQLTDEEKALNEQITKYKEEQREIENQILAAINWSGTMAIQFTGGAMVWPIAMEGTYITSGYGYRTHPIQGVYKKHAGIDISGANVYGAPVVAAADGVVIYAGWISGYGNCVMINHGNGIVSLYGHGSEIITTMGATVKQGTIVMKVGSTGNSTGPHVHFEIRKNGQVVDPIPYLNGEITTIDGNTFQLNNIELENEIILDSNNL